MKKSTCSCSASYYFPSNFPYSLVMFLRLIVIFMAVSFVSTSADDQSTGGEYLAAVDAGYRALLIESAGYGMKKLSSVLVMGNVVCRDCVEGLVVTEPAQGAEAIVTCRRGKKLYKAVGLTDKYGDFTIELPSELHALPSLETRCRVRILRVPSNSTCFPEFTQIRSRAARSRAHHRLRLSSIGNGVRAYESERIIIQTTRTGMNKKLHACPVLDRVPSDYGLSRREGRRSRGRRSRDRRNAIKRKIAPAIVRLDQ